MNHPRVRQVEALGWALHGVGLALALTAIGIYYWFAFKPMTVNNHGCRQRSDQLEAMLAQGPKVRSTNRELKAELAALKKSVAETQRRLPRELREHEFLEQVRTAASTTGIELGEYQLGMIEELASYSKAELTFLCHGSFASICKFLNEIDHLARITEIRNLQIETTDNFNRYPLRVTFVLYFGGATHDTTLRGEVL